MAVLGKPRSWSHWLTGSALKYLGPERPRCSLREKLPRSLNGLVPTHLLWMSERSVIFCPFPACTWGPPQGGVYTVSPPFPGKLPHIWLSLSRSLMKLSLEKTSPAYFSDNISCLHPCLLTILNLHLDHATYHSRVIIPLSVSITGLWKASLSPQCPAWDWCNASCYIFVFLMN